MIAFIDDHHQTHGVGSICKLSPIAPSTYHDHAAKRADPCKLSARAQRNGLLKSAVRRALEENFHVYGARKVWRQLKREGKDVARCIVARLTKAMELRVSNFTYVATWTGFVYVAFVIDVYARRIVGWRAWTAHAGFGLGALEQAIRDRRPVSDGGLVQHSDRGSQFLSIKYTERLAEAGVEPSVGSVGDSYDNPRAETFNGLYKVEVIHRRGPWRNFESVEFATPEWVDGFNNRQLPKPMGNIPPAGAELRYYAMMEEQDNAT